MALPTGYLKVRQACEFYKISYDYLQKCAKDYGLPIVSNPHERGTPVEKRTRLVHEATLASVLRQHPPKRKRYGPEPWERDT